MIGGVAVQAYGHNRTTMDLDVMVAAGRSTSRELAQALVALEASVRGANAHQFSTRFGDLDVFTGLVPGAAPFEELVARSTRVSLGGTHFDVVGLDDLIAMKHASGRPRDLDDIAALTLPSPD